MQGKKLLRYLNESHYFSHIPINIEKCFPLARYWCHNKYDYIFCFCKQQVKLGERLLVLICQLKLTHPSYSGDFKGITNPKTKV